MKILLADDSVTAQNMGKKILAEAGHEVVCVSNGAAALKKVAEQEPDLVILDIYMPGYSGLEVCQRLKEQRATAELPVVLTVGKLEPFRKEDAQRVRAEALIVKPFEASELAAAVARFAEMLNAKSRKSGKAKSGKLGPQPKPKAQWDEVPDDDFVTTSQKEMDKDLEIAGSAEKAQEPEAAGAEPPAIVEELEESPQPAATEFQKVAKKTELEGGPAEAASGENSWAQPAAEFSVQADSAVSPRITEPASEPPAMAKAAAAGAYFTDSAESSVPEFPVDNSSEAQSFSVSASAQAPAAASPEPSSMPGTPEMPTEVASSLPAATAEPGVDAPDPAFEPDRTQWATQFATRYGLAEDETSEDTAVEQHEAEAPQAATPGANETGTPQDEIAAILGNLPGGFSPSEAATPAAEREQFPEQSSAAESSAPANWMAEEVPVEDRESSISLSEEMEKATRMASDSSVTSFTSEAAAGQEPPSASSPAGEPENWQPPASDSYASQSPTTAPPFAEPQQPAPEAKPAQNAPDRVAGVMQSAAMAIATRATVSAVTSQLHSQPATANHSGLGAIEDLVDHVLERLKPKLIAEIKRELGTPEDK